jgi:hypothetical protein
MGLISFLKYHLALFDKQLDFFSSRCFSCSPGGSLDYTEIIVLTLTGNQSTTKAEYNSTIAVEYFDYIINSIKTP